MEPLNDLNILIEHLNSPAFLVKNGEITAINQEASHRMAQVGTPVQDLFPKSYDDYQLLSQGCLLTTISLAGTQYSCSIQRLHEQDLFILEETATNAELQALALAAEQLRFPLSELSIALDKLPTTQETQRGLLTHNLFKLHRLVGNMSDAALLINATPQLATYEICGIFEEVLKKASALFEEAGIVINYHLPQQPIYCLADQALLERAIYNLLSNAAKFTLKGTTIEISLKRVSQKLYFSVQSGDKNMENTLFDTMFTRYKRQPAIEDSRFGLGLGMTIIRAAATAHNGTVLVEQTNGTKVTMSLTIQKSNANLVRTPVLSLDVYGGKDQALIELSDVLPSSLYLNH